jgi:hypothetical protein
MLRAGATPVSFHYEKMDHDVKIVIIGARSTSQSAHSVGG